MGSTGFTMRMCEGTVADGPTLAALRWRRLAEEGGYTGSDRAELVAAFTVWLVDHIRSHRPFLAVTDSGPVGIAWLMVAERVPTPARWHRRYGDVQSVYVVPERRNSGTGAALLKVVLAEARVSGLEHVTVHSSVHAVPLYERVRFGHDPCWLSWAPG
jgi:GNAT superfamily N-acetyltransferase